MPLKRSPVRRKRPGKPRRGRVVDKDYLAWLHAQPGCVFGGRTATVHHVRTCGSPKNDRNALPMEFGYHQMHEGPDSIENLGKIKWQEAHGVVIETAIEKYQARYLAQHPGVKWDA